MSRLKRDCARKVERSSWITFSWLAVATHKPERGVPDHTLRHVVRFNNAIMQPRMGPVACINGVLSPRMACRLQDFASNAAEMVKDSWPKTDGKDVTVEWRTGQSFLREHTCADGLVAPSRGRGG